MKRGERIREYFDTIEINSQSTVFQAFSGVASGNDHEDNYDQNPLPGNIDRKIAEIKIEPTVGVIKAEANVSPRAILNALGFAAVVVNADADRKQLLHVPLSNFINLTTAGYNAIVNAAGLGLEEWVNLASAGYRRVADPFVLARNQTLKFKIVFGDTSGLPTSAQWIAATQETFRLRVTVKMIETEA